MTGIVHKELNIGCGANRGRMEMIGIESTQSK